MGSGKIWSYLLFCVFAFLCFYEGSEGGLLRWVGLLSRSLKEGF